MYEVVNIETKRKLLINNRFIKGAFEYRCPVVEVHFGLLNLVCAALPKVCRVAFASTKINVYV